MELGRREARWGDVERAGGFLVPPGGAAPGRATHCARRATGSGGEARGDPRGAIGRARSSRSPARRAQGASFVGSVRRGPSAPGGARPDRVPGPARNAQDPATSANGAAGKAHRRGVNYFFLITAIETSSSGDRAVEKA